MCRPWLLRFPTVVTACALCLAATKGPIAMGQEDAEALKEEQRLSGLWRVEVFEWDGQRSTAKEFKDSSSDIFDLRWLFTTTKAQTVVDVGDPDSKHDYARYKLNVRATPKTIDMEVNGSTFKGIYLIDERVLKACFSVRNPEGRKLVPGKEDRPTDFSTKENSERLLLIFVREEKAKK
jgi:uncharacterized protein (TIGR03067 family)